MMQRAPPPTTNEPVDLIVEDARWAALPLLAIARLALREAVTASGLDAAGYSISVLACDDARIAGLNDAFRGKPKPTNVLSWPAFELAAKAPGGRPKPPPPAPPNGCESLGDIAIAWDRIMQEAARSGTDPAHHTLHLLLHGSLHLLGYDHETEADAALMETIESQTLVRLGCKDPYYRVGPG